MPKPQEQRQQWKTSNQNQFATRTWLEQNMHVRCEGMHICISISVHSNPTRTKLQLLMKKILKNFPETVKDLHCGFQRQNFWQRNTNFITKITVTSLWNDKQMYCQQYNHLTPDSRAKIHKSKTSGLTAKMLFAKTASKNSRTFQVLLRTNVFTLSLNGHFNT